MTSDEANAEIKRLRNHIHHARDLVVEMYREGEANDSPGNMAFAILTAALSDPEAKP